MDATATQGNTLRIPLSRQVDSALRGSSLRLRLLAAGFVGLIVSLWVSLRMHDLDVPRGRLFVGTALVVVPVCVLVTLVFTQRDRVKARISAGEPVGAVSRMLFGGGVVSMLLGLVAAFLLCAVMLVAYELVRLARLK